MIPHYTMPNIDTIIENTEKLKNKENINFEEETNLEDDKTLQTTLEEVKL